MLSGIFREESDSGHPGPDFGFARAEGFRTRVRKWDGTHYNVMSRGQLKLMVCALRVAQGQHLTEITGKQCVYLIDDFASELDSQRRKRLADCLKETGAQVFVSSITQNQIADMDDENGKMFRVEHGTIEQTI